MSDVNDFFISYSKSDYQTVNDIVTKMESYHAVCWFQRRNSKNFFANAILEGISGSRFFVVFLSPQSVRSIFVQNEIKCAIDRYSEDRSYRILPVILNHKVLEMDEFKALNIFIGTFNMLDFEDFSSVDELVLKIFDQVDFHYTDEESVQSIYTGDSEIETERLKIQTKLLNLYVNDYIDEIFRSGSAATILDVGCADGSTIMSRIAKRDYSFLLGVDVNPLKIKVAQTNYASAQNRFEHLDITSDEFSSKVMEIIKERNCSGFDFIHVSSVLLHMPEPHTVLRKLYDLLNPGGYLFIQEEDDGLNKVYPTSSYFDNCFYIYTHSLESGDRKSGRKIPYYLKQAGFKKYQLKRSAITSIDFDGKYKKDLWDMYFNPHYWDATNASYFDTIKAVDLLPAIFDEHESVMEEFLNSNIFIMLGFLFYIARK